MNLTITDPLIPAPEDITSYRLLPSQEVVTRDNAGVPKESTLTFRVLKTMGDTATEVSSWNDEGLSLWSHYILEEVEYNTEHGGTDDAEKSVDATLFNAMYSVLDLVEWLLKKNGEVVDRIGIGSVSDGATGPTPSVYELLPTPTEILVSLGSNGYVPATVAVTVGHSKDGTVVKTNDTTAFDGYNIYFRRRLRSTGVFEGYYIRYSGGTATRYTNARSLLSAFDVATYDQIEFFMSGTASTTGRTVDGKSVYAPASLSKILKNRVVNVVSNGIGGVTWKLRCDVVRALLSRDYAGVVTACPTNMNTEVHRSVGDALTVFNSGDDLPEGTVMEYSRDGGTTWVLSADENDIGGSHNIEMLMRTGGSSGNYSYCSSFSIRLKVDATVSGSTVTGGTVADLIHVGIEWDVQRMLVPAGEFVKNASPTKTWTRTDRTCPLVLYKGFYYFLDADSATSNCTTDATNEPLVSGTSKWKRAEEYEVVVTKMLFALFAKLGGFIIVGDYFFSQYGTLVSSIGEELTIGSSNYTTEYGADSNGHITTSANNKQVPYAWFNDGTPMADDLSSIDQGDLNFRPALCLNAKTGAAWYASGKVYMNATGDVSVEGHITARSISTSFVDLAGKYIRSGSSYKLLGKTNRFVVGTETIYKKVNSTYTAIDIRGVTNFMCSGVDIDLPDYATALIGRHYTFFNPVLAPSGNVETIIAICDTGGSTGGTGQYFYGIGKNPNYNSNTAVPSNHVLPSNVSSRIWTFDKVSTIYFINGCVEVMAIPGDSQSVDVGWTVLAIGTNCYLLG